MILDTLADAARERTRARQKEISFAKMRHLAESLPQNRAGCFQKVLQEPGLHIIAEVKKASPSKGLIAPLFPYETIAETYEKSGASAISVLTEPTRFLGKDAYLEAIRRRVKVPVLRKDFTVDPYMVYEARCLGADAVLLIAALLSDAELSEYRQMAESLGMDALVEAHDEREVERALKSGAAILGVNNRNLKDFTVDIGNSLRLRSLVPPGIPFIAESGIHDGAAVKRLAEHGVSGVLIGELLMRSPSIEAKMKELMEAAI